MIKTIMKKYNPKQIEPKWQEKWYGPGAFKAKNGSKKKKFYLLFEFPYPSGDGLHVGHCRPYIGLDVIARKLRMEGLNVLFPIGWDAFGLPTENYAIKKGIHPSVATKKNTDNFRRQMKMLGLSLDWSREINTTDPKYYKWTQWIFIQLFKQGLAYKSKIAVNYCPSCKITLANEEVIDNRCERCGEKVIQKEREQWMLKITKYADRLIDDLDKVDYPDKVKISQREWIGKSQGFEIDFKVENHILSVFTTRPDTIFGCTYLVLSPEHPVLPKLKAVIKNYNRVETYINKAKQKSERERISEIRDKTGIEIYGIKAINPANNRQIPVFVADYVLAHYGTGAVMAVPAHDQRDFDFAKKYNLPIVEVITGNHNLDRAYEREGTLVNSQRFDGLLSEKAEERIGQWLANKNLARKKVNYKLRDWVFSRQHYWGEPTPMVNCLKCGWQPVLEKDLPIKLPEIKRYRPSREGDSPLVNVKEWVETKCPKCKGMAYRETDTMPNWAGSNWYYLAYLMRGISNFQFPISKYENTFKYWMPVDWYNGGMEHTTLHLLYSRFVFKFLWDIGAVPKSIGPEPYQKRTSHGMVLGEGGIKMSKSKGNIINPDSVVRQYGADTLRVYEMFMGPFEQMIPWDTKGVIGVRRFLEKIWKLAVKSQNPMTDAQTNPKSQIPNSKLRKLLHKTIKKVGEDIESMKFNTAISSMMEFVNEWNKNPEAMNKKDFADFLKILSPFAPHLAEELWDRAGLKGLALSQKWPKFDTKLIEDKNVLLIVQINGKVRDKIEIKSGIDQKQAEKLALKSDKIKNLIGKNKEIIKTIFVPDKLMNFVAIDKKR